jgi:phenylacetate-CoA ligase
MMPRASGKSDLEAVLWPPVRLGDNAVLAAMLAELDASQWLPEEAIREAQGAQLRALAEHHGMHSPHFARRLREADISAKKLDNLERLARLPPISRRDVQSAGALFFAAEVPRSHLPVGTTCTSGSTGEPVTLRRTAVNQLFWSLFAVRDHFWNKRSFRGRMSSIRANIRAYVETKDWGSPVANLYESGRGQGIPITTGLEEQLRLMERFRPHVLVVYPSNLNALAGIWEERGFKLGSIKHIKTMGETVVPELRDRIRGITGLAIEDNYSSNEAGAIAIECPESSLYHIMAETLIVEVLDGSGRPCRGGEIGRVVLTDLHNFASPLIRYAIGDFAKVGGPCPCGRGLPTLRRILGRERNLLLRPDGTRHWPIFGFHRFRDVAPVRQYQFVQHTVTEIEFKVVADGELTGPQETALVEIARGFLGRDFDIRLTQVRDRLALPASGKFEEFVCRAA